VMKRVLSIVIAAVALTIAGTASGGGPPVAPVEVGSGLGCEAQCIKQATVVAGPFAAVLDVRTDAPARIKVKVSDVAPTQATSGPHFYTWDAADSTGAAYKTQWTTTLLGLQAGTLYHIVVWATDAEGRTAYQQGRFRTKGRTVEVTFWKVKVLNDADKGKLDKGEISFEGELNGDDAWAIGEKKLASGNSFHPHPADERSSSRMPRATSSSGSVAASVMTSAGKAAPRRAATTAPRRATAPR
jgi:hypothetical protein